ncbi:hypothetical protein [Actinomadura barringtoniae]|uniref:hypothetical protein n=1 Tax=Actinomadura barringtoniae TaxID=1427535 RepID=UPI0027DD62F8|nr:hypothetical protein [Actinomadura barringtoniae]
MELEDENVVIVGMRGEALTAAGCEVEVDSDSMMERRFQRSAKVGHGGGSSMNPVDDDRVAVVIGAVDVLDVGDPVVVQRHVSPGSVAVALGSDQELVVGGSDAAGRRRRDQFVDLVDPRQPVEMACVVPVDQERTILPVFTEEVVACDRMEKSLDGERPGK